MKNATDVYHKIIDEIEDYAVLLLDQQGTITDWNKGAEKLKGYKAGEIIGKNFRIFYTPQDLESKLPEKLIEKAILNGKALDEGWRVRKDGSCFWGSILITAIYNEEHQLTGFLKITRDLTERKSIEERLKTINEELELRVNERTEKLEAAEKQYRHTLDNMLEGVQIHDFNWRYLYVNDALIKYSTYSRDELMGYTLMEKYPGIEQTDLFKALQRVMDSRSAEHLETEFIFPNGAKGYFELSIQPVPEGIFILSVDIGEKKRANEALQKHIKELYDYKFAIDESAIVAKTDQKGIIRHVNKNFCKISKYTEAELLGQDHRIINSGFHSKEFIRNLWVTIANGKIWKGELKNKAKDGTYYWVDTTIVPFLNEAGKPYQYLAIRSDITERKSGEEKIRKSARLYAFLSAINQSIVHIHSERELLDNACSVGTTIGGFKIARMGLLDETGKLNMVSSFSDKMATDALQRFSGVDYASPELRDTITGRTLRTGSYTMTNNAQSDPALHPWKDELAQQGINSMISLPVKKFGKIAGAFVLCSGIENFFDNEEISLLEEATNDISFALENFEKEKLRLRAEKDLETKGVRLVEAQAIAKVSSWEIDMVNNAVYWSDEQYILLGLKKGEVESTNELFFSFVHHDDLAFVMDRFNYTFEVFENASTNFRLLLHNGTVKHVYCEWRFEFEGHPKPVRIFGIIQDITEKKAAEEEILKLNSELEERVKLRTAELLDANKQLESFSYTVSHDLRSPLQVISGYASILIKKYGSELNDDAQQLLQGIKDYTKKMAQIMEDLLNFSKLGHTKVAKTEVNMNDIVKVVIQELRAGNKKTNAHIKLYDLKTANCDKGLMHQVWANLISNALKYSKKEEKAIIEIGRSEIKGESVYYIKDNGVGFDMKYVDKLFAIFQRLHHQSDFEGTGVGLALVHSIITKHGGKIWAEGKVSEGATFYFTLPGPSSEG